MRATKRNLIDNVEFLLTFTVKRKRVIKIIVLPYHSNKFTIIYDNKCQNDKIKITQLHSNVIVTIMILVGVKSI